MTVSGRYLLSCSALAAACAAAGGLAALTADSETLTVAVWPPVGIALAVLAVRGPHLWPGVWVAIAAVAYPFTTRLTPGPGWAALLAAWTATAYTAQAVFGAWLARRVAGTPLRLTHPREIALFLAVAGPVHTAPAPALAAAAACYCGPRPWAEFGSLWLTWWWNDALGGLLFAPITLTVIGTPRDLWRPRLGTVAVPLGATAALIVAVFVAARYWDERAAARELDRTADLTAARTVAEFDRLADAFDAGRCIGRLDAAAARAWAREFRLSSPAAAGVLYGPLTRDGNTVTAPVVAADAAPDALPRVGSDLAAHPAFRDAIERAAATRRPAAAPAPAGGVVVFVVCRPSAAGPPDRTASGFVACVVDPAALLARAGAAGRSRLPVTLTAPGDSLPQALRAGRTVTRQVVLGGREWDLTATGDPAFLAANRTHFAWAAVAGGVAVGVLAAAWLLAVSGRAAAVDEEVGRRTAELARQIAARELTEAALRASEARLAEAQRIARLGYWEWDPVTGDGYWCGVSEDLLGAAAGGPDDPDLLALVHPDDRPRFEQAARGVVATRRRGELEFRVVRPDGAERWVQAWLEASDADGMFLVQGTLQDVTDRKRAELALRAGEARLAEAQRIARIGSWEWDCQTRTIWWSDEMYRLFEFPAGATPTPETFFSAVHPDDRAIVRTRAQATLAQGEPFVFDFRLVLPRGERVLHVEGVVDRDPAGRPLVLRGATQDVTDRVRAEEERRRFDEQLRQTQKLESLGVLAGGVAHDFNNLLTGILGNASLAREATPLGSDLHEFLRPIEHAAAHAASLCQQMLAYAGRGATIRGALHLNRLIADTADLLRLSASKKVELRFAPAQDLPVLEGDPSQIRQVLLNLVSNASEAVGDAAGVIEVSTGYGRPPCQRAGDGHRCGDLPPGEYAWVQVRDTGCGMPADVVRRIFEPFFTTKFTGRGLGLSAVHGIARSHGGAVCVTSAPGAGTTFRVYLAVPPGEPTIRTPQIVHTPARIAHPIRRAGTPADPAAGVAVVADDDPAVRQLVTVALQSLGFEVRAAENGAAAVELVRAGGAAVRVAVLDVLMPVMDGREALAELRAVRPDLPVIVMSGYSDPDLARDLIDGGVVGFVQKPFRPVDLTACVRRAVARGGHPAGAL